MVACMKGSKNGLFFIFCGVGDWRLLKRIVQHRARVLLDYSSISVFSGEFVEGKGFQYTLETSRAHGTFIKPTVLMLPVHQTRWAVYNFLNFGVVMKKMVLRRSFLGFASQLFLCMR